MRVFVYEYLTAKGVGREPNARGHDAYREGRAMRDAVAADFARLPNTEVVTFADADAPVDRDQFLEAADAATWTLVVAPESGEILADLAEEVWPLSCRFLGPSAAAIKLTSDKHDLADHWRDNDIPTPATSDREPAPCEAFPVVWKPRDGCGSAATFLLTTGTDVARAKATRRAEGHDGPMILQEFVPGRAASVAFLCGPAGNVPLLPAFQTLSGDGRFRYEGGELPIPDDLAARAVRLGKFAVNCVPGFLGYVGVDVVLGEAANGSQDYAIEINPRLTTSYVGLRAAAEFNIAEVMLKVAKGETPGPLAWKPGRVRFGASGVEAHG